MLLISSPQNPHIKRIKALQEKARKRKEEGAFVIEGEKEIKHALASNFQLEQLYFKEKAEISEDLIQSAPKESIRLAKKDRAWELQRPPLLPTVLHSQG